MFEFCQEIRGHFSDYLDGVCSRETLRSLRYHLSYCSACNEELQRWQAMQADLRALPRRRAPQKYALKLRVALSQELHRNLLGRLPCQGPGSRIQPMAIFKDHQERCPRGPAR